MLNLNVDLGDRSYPIFIGVGLFANDSQSEYLLPYIKGRQVAIVTNSTIAPLYLNQVKEMLAGFDLTEIILPDGEVFKNLDTLNSIFDKLLESRHTRKTTLIALGGGVVGDMTGFAAACYQRGVDFIQMPTTLLSQVDSSVGGKTGINHALGKNMMGAFHQPNVVLIDTDTLKTLPDREFSAGMAEIIKYGLICDPEFYDWLKNNMADLMARKNEALTYAIHRSCFDKAQVVAQDETETGIRAILNLGHTFGHAIETQMGYGEWLHGEAVAAGMAMAAELSSRLGNITDSDVSELIGLLGQAGLPVVPPKGMTPNQFKELMIVDKKVLDGRLRLVLLDAVGKAAVTDEFDIDVFEHMLRDVCIC